MNDDNATKRMLKRYPDVFWTDEIDSLLGKCTDREISERFGIAPRAVRQRRNRLQIKSTTVSSSAPPDGRRSWTNDLVP